MSNAPTPTRQRSRPYVDLDFAAVTTDPVELLSVAAEYVESCGFGPADVSPSIVSMEGPGGGWPVIRFTGEPAAVQAVEDHYFAEQE
jgi:hypothetical protein